MAILTGFAYPLEVDASTGSLKLQSDGDLIADHILSWLETEPLERVMRLDYGTPGYLFTTQQNWQAIAAAVEQRLRANIPQAVFTVMGALTDDGEAELTVNWAIPGMGDQEAIQVVLT